MRYLFGVRGRLGRLRYLFAIIGWCLWLPLVLLIACGLASVTEAFGLVSQVIRYPATGGEALDAAVHAGGQGLWLRYALIALAWILAFASFMALTARRLHDIGRPAHYAWIAVLPFVGLVATFWVLVFLPGDREANLYGPSPVLAGRADPSEPLPEAGPAR